MLNILTASDLLDEVQKLYERGMPRGDKTGWIELDRYYSIQQGYWTVITGIPSHGKSTWMDNLMVHLMASGWKFVIYSPENQPHQIHVASLIEKIIGSPMRTGYSTRVSPADIAQAISLIDDSIRFLALPDDALCMATLDDVLEMADQAIPDLGDKVAILIDPWNELDHTRVLGMAETEYISYQLSKWRQYHRSRNTHGFIVAHPTKIMRTRSNDGTPGKFVVPSLYDINGSAHWFNKTDNGIVIWRDEDKPGTVEIHVKKVKFKHCGAPGVAYLDYDAVTGIYYDGLGYDSQRYTGMGQRPCNFDRD